MSVIYLFSIYKIISRFYYIMLLFNIYFNLIFCNNNNNLSDLKCINSDSTNLFLKGNNR